MSQHLEGAECQGDSNVGWCASGLKFNYPQMGVSKNRGTRAPQNGWFNGKPY